MDLFNALTHNRSGVRYGSVITRAQPPGMRSTLAAGLDEQVPSSLALERLRECSELQEPITARRRRQLVGTVSEVLVDRPGRARSYGKHRR